jgi:hypothetical protein
MFAPKAERAKYSSHSNPLLAPVISIQLGSLTNMMTTNLVLKNQPLNLIALKVMTKAKIRSWITQY